MPGIWWLDQHATAVQALAAVLTLAVTVVLAILTGRYVHLTHELLTDAREARQAERVRARHPLNQSP